MAKEKLRLEDMTPGELRAYYRHMDNVVILKDNIITAAGEARLEARAEGLAQGIAQGKAQGKAEGLAEGRAEGLAQGKAEGRAEGLAEGASSERLSIAKKMLASGLDIDTIVQLTGIRKEDIL